jgi:NADP-dependent 3-hydroxy acid dehydrogenase YdfG
VTVPSKVDPCFNGKLAIVTGASSGIGRAIALALAASGANLHIVGRKRASLEAIAGACATQVSSFTVDFENSDETERWAAGLRETCDHVDFLIHSAGMISIARMEQARVADFDRQYRVNVRAPYVITKAVLPLLRACRGQVVFLNSSAGLQAGATVGQYAATKHALAAVADSLREECNPDGIRVLSVYPGRTATPMQICVHEAEGKEYTPERLMQPGDVASAVVAALRMPPTAEVTEIRMRPATKS